MVPCTRYGVHHDGKERAERHKEDRGRGTDSEEYERERHPRRHGHRSKQLNDRVKEIGDRFGSTDQHADGDADD